jgi:G3E family GTPase
LAQSPLSRYPEARRQAALADRILLTKCDVAAPAEIAALREALRRAAPAVPVLQATETGIAPDALFGSAEHRPLPAPSGFAAHRADIAAHAFAVEGPVTRDALALFMDLMAAYRGGAVLRLKGVLDVDGCPTEIQGVLQAFHPPLWLPAWPGGVRRPGLVVVTDGLSRADLEPALAALRFERVRKGQMPSPETYARFRAIAERLR